MEIFIEIEKLKKNTLILLETKDTVYEIRIIGPKRGVCSISGGTRFFEGPTKAKIQGTIDCSEKSEGDLMVGVIHKDKCLQIAYGKRWEHVFVSSIVRSAKITSPDDKWSYEVWNAKNTKS